MRRAIALCAVIAALPAAPARAEIRVIDVVTGASTTLVADRDASVLRWADDSTGVLFRDGHGEIARVGLDGAVTPLQHPSKTDLGSGGRAIVRGPKDDGYELRAPDGHVVAQQRVTAWGLDVATVKSG